MRGELVFALMLAAGCAGRPTEPLELHIHPLPEGPIEPEGSTRDPLPDVPSDELEQRLSAVKDVLRRNARDTRIWFAISTEFYATGLLVQAGRAATETDPVERADLAFSAAKAAVGVAGRLAHPPRAVFGATPDELYPGSSHAAMARRLVTAERMLTRDAKQNDNRYSWIGHTVNVTLNVAGMLYVGLVYHDWARATQSAGIGIAVGETSLWLQPWTAKRGLKSYRQRWGGLAIDGPTRLRF